MTDKQHFYPLRVKEVNRETTDTVSISFELNAIHKELFSFIQGQYLTLRLEVNGEEHRRSYSICTAPYEGLLKVAVKKVDNGAVSTYLNEELEAGDYLDVMPPMGKFHTPLNAANSGHYVAIAAGSGITPVISIVKSVLNVEPNSRVSLIYGNRETQSIIFREELERLSAEYKDRLNIIYVLSRESTSSPLFEGRIDRQKLEQLVSADESLAGADHYFICGPYEMIRTASGFFEEKGIAAAAIHFELFTVPEDDKEDTSVTESASDADEPSNNSVSQVTILLDDEETHIELKKDGQAILDAAIAAGIDPPYSCKGAVCTTCMARLKKGKVKMDMNHALTDSELEDGYILTCQSHPVTDEVSVSYDDI